VLSTESDCHKLIAFTATVCSLHQLRHILSYYYNVLSKLKYTNIPHNKYKLHILYISYIYPSASGIDITGTVVPFRDSIKLLSVTLDSVLTMDRHVTEVIRSCSYHTCALRHIRPLLTLDVANMIGHSTVSSRLDYANALLHGTSAYINRLQVVQNSLVRTVCQAPQSASATELHRQLHLLPVRQRISYKVTVITYKTCSTSILAYLSDLLQDY